MMYTSPTHIVYFVIQDINAVSVQLQWRDDNSKTLLYIKYVLLVSPTMLQGIPMDTKNVGAPRFIANDMFNKNALNIYLLKFNKYVMSVAPTILLGIPKMWAPYGSPLLKMHYLDALHFPKSYKKNVLHMLTYVLLCWVQFFHIPLVQTNKTRINK